MSKRKSATVATGKDKPGCASVNDYTDGPSREDVGWWWLYRDDWGWQPVCVAYHSFIQAGDGFRHPITEGMKWGQKVSPYNGEFRRVDLNRTNNPQSETPSPATNG